MKHKYTIIIIFISMLTAQLSPLELAREYVKDNNYNSAIIEYKRYLFFNNGLNNYDILKELYNVYHTIGDWANALITLESADILIDDDFMKDRMLIDKGVILISKGDLQRAEMLFARLLMSSKHESIKKDTHYWLGVCNLYSFKWEEAKNYFNHYYGELYKQDIDNIFADINELNIKSPSKARLLSLIMPGLGQIYLNDYKNGINSFMLNLLTSYVFFNSIIDKNYLDALIIYYTPFERYYLGSHRNAEVIAKNYNQQLSQQFAKSVLDNILEIH